MVDLLKSIRGVLGWPASRKFVLVSEAGIRAAFARHRPDLEADIAAVLDEVQETPGVAYLLFDVWAEFAFDEFPIRAEVFDARGEHVEGAVGLDGRKLLPGSTLLPTEEGYPLGRFDWLGTDTTSDMALVERVCIDEFQTAWADIERTLPGVQVLLGRWAPLLECEQSFPLVDLATGAPVIVDVLWGGRS